MNSNISQLILDTIQDLHPSKNGIKFLINFLNDNIDEGSSAFRKPTLMESFYLNVKNIPNLIKTKETWEKIIETGDVEESILTAFDWDLSPEGYEFWDKVNNKFLNAYRTALSHGLKFNENTPMRNSNTNTSFYPSTAPIDINPKKDDIVLHPTQNYTKIEIMPSEITLKMLKYLAPTCEHLVNPQIDVLNKILTEKKCKNQFFAYLRNKPKHNNYELEFKNMLNNGDLRTIIYWSFNWASTTEGYSFWSKINGDVYNAITKELTNGGYKFPLTVNNSGEMTPSTSLTRKHYEEGLVPYAYRNYPNYDMFEDDYDDEYFDYGSFYGYYYAPSVPKDIINMPINENYIELVLKEEKVLTPSAT